MGIFIRRNNMSAEYRNALRQIRQNRSKLYRSVRIAVILVAVLAAVFLALAISVESLRAPASFKVSLAVLAVCVGGAACLPWITQFERDRRRKARGEEVPQWRFILTYAFFAFIGVCTLLWVIAVFVVGDDIINNIINSSGEGFSASTFTFLRVAIIFSLQALFGSVIATGILRHGKSNLPLRAVMYVTIAYLDVWLSWVAGGITVAGIEDGTFLPISSTPLWVIAVLTAVALFASASILAGQTRRKEIELIMKGDVSALTEGDVNLIDTQAATANMYRADAPAPAPTPAGEPAEEDAETRLERLVRMRDKGLISEEEYEEKRKEILAKM